MGRGKTADEGATRVAPNGYHYTKVDGRWRLTHHLVAEKMLGRPLKEGERVVFKTGNKLKLTEDNIQVVQKGSGSVRRRKAVLEARIEEMQAELDAINRELGL